MDTFAHRLPSRGQYDVLDHHAVTGNVQAEPSLSLTHYTSSTTSPRKLFSVSQSDSGDGVALYKWNDFAAQPASLVRQVVSILQAQLLRIRTWKRDAMHRAIYEQGGTSAWASSIVGDPFDEHLFANRPSQGTSRISWSSYPGRTPRHSLSSEHVVRDSQNDIGCSYDISVASDGTLNLSSFEPALEDPSLPSSTGAEAWSKPMPKEDLPLKDHGSTNQASGHGEVIYHQQHVQAPQVQVQESTSHAIPNRKGSTRHDSLDVPPAPMSSPSRSVTPVISSRQRKSSMIASSSHKVQPEPFTFPGVGTAGQPPCFRMQASSPSSRSVRLKRNESIGIRSDTASSKSKIASLDAVLNRFPQPPIPQHSSANEAQLRAEGRARTWHAQYARDMVVDSLKTL